MTIRQWLMIPRLPPSAVVAGGGGTGGASGAAEAAAVAALNASQTAEQTNALLGLAIEAVEARSGAIAIAAAAQVAADDALNALFSITDASAVVAVVDVEVVGQSGATVAAAALGDSFGGASSVEVDTENLTLEIGTGLAQVDTVAAGAVSGNALGVTLNGLKLTGVESGTVLATEDVPDFDYASSKVSTTESGQKVATIVLSQTETTDGVTTRVNVSIQGNPKLVVNDDGNTVLAVENPVLVADVPVVAIDNTGLADVILTTAQTAITSAAATVDVPVNADSVGGGASITVALVSNPVELEQFEGFTLESDEEPLRGLNVDTNIETTGVVSLTMELNAEAYDPDKNYNIRRISGGVESNLGAPIVDTTSVPGKVIFRFVSAGLSIFILVDAPESTVTTDVFASLKAVDNLTILWRFSNADQGLVVLRPEAGIRPGQHPHRVLWRRHHLGLRRHRTGVPEPDIGPWLEPDRPGVTLGVGQHSGV